MRKNVYPKSSQTPRLSRLESEKRTREKLRESEENIAALLNTNIDHILITKLDGTILRLNQLTAQWLGKSTSELIGRRVNDLFQPDIASQRKVQVEKVIATGAPVRFEDERNGHYFDHTIFPISDKQSNIVRLGVISRDITDHKRLEKILQGE